MTRDDLFEKTLYTERLILRPIQRNDAQILWEYLSDPAISRFMAWETHQNIQQTRDFICHEINRRESRQGITWTIIHGDSLCGIISLIGLTYTHRALIYDKAELAYWLGQPHQGIGIMTEAGKRVLAFCYDELMLHKITVSHFSENDRSENLIKPTSMCMVTRIASAAKNIIISFPTAGRTAWPNT